jgi:hypothetical protein
MLGVTWLDCRDGEDWTPLRGVGADKELTVGQPPAPHGQPKTAPFSDRIESLASVTKPACQVR